MHAPILEINTCTQFNAMLIANDVSPSIVEKREVNLLHSLSQLLLQSNLYTSMQYAIAMAN